jgi:hypothetical protein
MWFLAGAKALWACLVHAISCPTNFCQQLASQKIG